MNIHLLRQIEHWHAATHRLDAPDTLAAQSAWELVELSTGNALRSRLDGSLNVLKSQMDSLLQKTRSGALTEREGQQALQQLRKSYLQTEVTLDYFGDAVNTRTDLRTGNHLMALDYIAREAMRKSLQPLGHLVPPVMTYLDKGLGASILKAGLRLWDRRGVNPVAIIKVVRHNLYRPTALIHEAGHQIAYAIGWNEELARALQAGMRGFGPKVARLWASWSSEIAADAFAFIFTGYAAVATLKDVLSGSNRMVFHYHPGAPHPIPYVRTLIGTAMCRAVYGAGPWDEMESSWKAAYPLSEAPDDWRALFAQAEEQAKVAVDIVLQQTMQSFGGQSMLAHLPPEHLHPSRLLVWRAREGPVSDWSIPKLRANTLSLLALSVYQQVSEPSQAARFRLEMDGWFQRLGTTIRYELPQPT
ncbi:hypothetical protein [Neolewinella agarilytica]|uniref:Uncharacterized protein n=1 Tax=Neolewinella agarilytica TaxID=478744 RepID=A0A1H9H8K8_9BACT|nr:hypothetical protein [Neolewinella agarilytica]SEQ58587.1 hypothetical protein SAMN05444359_11257 [Neolewinella agarilytica]